MRTLFPLDPGPEGFKYAEELLPRDEEEALVSSIQELPLREFEFHGYTGNRRVASFGWRYDFSAESLEAAQPIPTFLIGLRSRAAEFAGVGPTSFVHILVTEYRPGTAIGWHRDKYVFGDVVGVSLASSCNFRFRKKEGERWERYSLTVEPRSFYLLRGESRTLWEHSIPPVDKTRYSVTFRTLRTTETNRQIIGLRDPSAGGA